jgi:signal transduction histidine kinase
MNLKASQPGGFFFATFGFLPAWDMTKSRTTRYVFRLLAAYVLFQFFWWAYHIIQLHGVVRDLEISMVDSAQVEAIQAGYWKKVWMVLGEGAVFVILLLFGLWRIGAYLRKEAELARQERNFMLAVTHELKTPVATLRLFLDTLRSRELPKVQSTRILEDALNETHRLDHLVENILLSTQFEQVHQAVFDDLDFSRFVERIVKKLEHTAGQEHTVQLVIEPDIQLHGDANLLESLVANLVDNAVKYSPAGSEIQVELKKRNGVALLRVLDQGQGIAKEEQLKIFKKFYRVGNEETRRSKGTGLGLYLVAQIAHQHGGEVSVRPVLPSGSCFEVILPTP